MIEQIVSIHNKLPVRANPQMNLLFDSKRLDLELLHSNIIAAILEPSRPGGSQRINCFLKQLGLDTQRSRRPWRIHREWDHIDILLEDGINAIIIENKINANDQPRQLQRYFYEVRQNYRVQALVYLTPSGTSPSLNSKGRLSGTLLKCISYHRDLTTWLKNCIRLERDPEICKNLGLYKEAITLMTQERETERQAIQLIFKNKGLRYSTLDLIRLANDRYCKYAFLSSLKKLLQLRLHIPTKLYINNEDLDDDFGLNIAVGGSLRFGIEFDDKDLYLSLYSDSRIETTDIIKKVRQGNFRKWIIWCYCSSIPEIGSFRRAAMDGREIEIWRQRAANACGPIADIFNEMKRLVCA
jgi:hypothetical protein